MKENEIDGMTNKEAVLIVVGIILSMIITNLVKIQ